MTRPLRIAHISDTHLGYRALPNQDPLTGRNQRSVDVEQAFSRAVDDILQQDIDLVLHGGDVFHQSRPNWHSLRHFVMEMRRIEAAGIPTAVIAGNHDTPRYRAGGSVFSVLEVALPDIRISAGYEEEDIIFDDLGVRIQAVPHGALTNPDTPVTFAIPQYRNILMTHGMTAGILKPGQVTEPGEQELGSELFPPEFAYVALGHYHIKTSPFAGAWYSGSTERFGWGDHDATPGYLLLTMDEEGNTDSPEHRPVHTRQMRRLEPIYGDTSTVDEVIDNVLDQIDRLADPTAMASVQIRNAERHTVREVERRLKREVRDSCFHLVVQRAATDTTGSVEELSTAASMQDLKTLFAEFVAMRKGDHYSDQFATKFLERGAKALDDAQRIVDDSQMEGGGS